MDMNPLNRSQSSQSRPASQVQQSNHEQSAMVSMPETSKKSKGMGMGKFQKISLVTVFVPVLILVALLVVFLGQSTNENKGIEKFVKGNQYQAVFLTGGQAYFGKISSITKDYMIMDDIYYLRADSQPQTTQDGKTLQNQQPNITLQKLGGEIHGPERTMFIRNEQILFWENLTDSGQVVDAIKRDKSGKVIPTPTTTPAHLHQLHRLAAQTLTRSPSYII